MKFDSHSALSSRNFRTYIYGNVFSVLGVWIQRLALGWHAWQLSESTLVVGVVAAAQFLPLILFTPFFGVIVDQISTRRGAIVLHVLLTIIAGAMAALTMIGSMTTEWLITLAFLHGIANSAYSPVRLALIPNLLDRKKFPSAVAISSMVFNISRFIGPGIAGAIIAAYGLGWAYLINAVTYLPVIFVLAIIRIDEQPADAGGDRSYASRLAEGIRYAREHAPIRQIILLAGVSNFFGRGVLELMPAFAALVFAGGSGVLATLMAASGVGAIAASALYSWRQVGTHRHALVVAGSFGVAISIVLFALSANIVTGVMTVLLLSMFASVVSIGSQTEVQLQVKNRLRGRVMSIWTLAIIGGPAIGSVVAGALTESFGVRSTSISFAIACVALILFVGIRKPAAESR